MHVGQKNFHMRNSIIFFTVDNFLKVVLTTFRIYYLSGGLFLNSNFYRTTYGVIGKPLEYVILFLQAMRASSTYS